jgi:hypothetical protein
MASSDGLAINIELAFPTAGVNFHLSVDSGPEAGAAFGLRVSDANSGAPVAFTQEASPELADWVRGYTRWLYRSRVRASHDTQAISGAFVEGVTPQQVLEGLGLACDMIRQRFDSYQESVLG